MYKRQLRLFGDTETKKVTPQVGPEQEYFLVDKEMYLKREDLRLCGRTLFGAKPPKGQELDDHYYGSIRPRVAAFMRDLDEELWKLGVLSKTCLLYTSGLHCLQNAMTSPICATEKDGRVA